MDKNIKELLDKEIEREILEMYLQDPKTDGYSAATDRLAKLYKLRTDEEDRWIKFAVDASTVVLPLVFYAVWMGLGLRFEETGSFTSTTFRGLISHFRPKK
jgi:hypothetical protein